MDGRARRREADASGSYRRKIFQHKGRKGTQRNSTSPPGCTKCEKGGESRLTRSPENKSLSFSREAWGRNAGEAPVDLFGLLLLILRHRGSAVAGELLEIVL